MYVYVCVFLSKYWSTVIYSPKKNIKMGIRSFTEFW